MKVSPEGLSKIADREGLRTTAYRDTRGIWTIGVGHTSAAGDPDVYEGLTITREEALAIFAKDIAPVEDCINQTIRVPLEQHQFDAFASITFNIGDHGFATSSMARDTNAGNLDAVYDDIMKWNKPPEIIGRRKQEADQWEGQVGPDGD